MELELYCHEFTGMVLRENIAYASREMSKSKRKYSVTRKVDYVKDSTGHVIQRMSTSGVNNVHNVYRGKKPTPKNRAQLTSIIKPKLSTLASRNGYSGLKIGMSFLFLII